MSQIIPHLMLIYGNYNITAEKTITGGIPKSWCDYSPEVTCGLHPRHISGVTIDSAFKIYSFYSYELSIYDPEFTVKEFVLRLK